jgi:predicted branched-subunit amino acid permease
VTTAGSAARDGARTAIPLGLAAFPFGLVYGVAVAESSINGLLGVAASWIVLAGAAQLTLLGLIDDGAAWPIAVGTALMINARFALYSTALATPFRDFPARWRHALPYLLTDQAATLSLLHFEREADPDRRRRWFLGAALLFASGWWIGTVVGYVAGGVIPDQVDIGFAVPAMFIALLVPTLVDRPALVAAGVAGTVAVATSALPNGLNVIAAALGGIAVARLLTPSPNTSKAPG